MPNWLELPANVCASTSVTTIPWGYWDGPFTARVISMGCGQATTALIGLVPSSDWIVPINTWPAIVVTPVD